LALWGAIRPDDLAGAVVAFTGFVVQSASWWWLILCTGFVAQAAVMALGPYGGVRLGADDERPEFSTPSLIAMLFAGGMGSGLLFCSVAEPISHFAPPPGLPGGTPEAAHAAMRFTMLHWGLHA
jgi:glycine betaine transporter